MWQHIKRYTPGRNIIVTGLWWKQCSRNVSYIRTQGVYLFSTRVKCNVFIILCCHTIILFTPHSLFYFLTSINQKKKKKNKLKCLSHSVISLDVDESKSWNEKFENEVRIVPINSRIPQEMFKGFVFNTLWTLVQRLQTKQTLDYTCFTGHHERTTFTFVLDTWRWCHSLDRWSDREKNCGYLS